MLNCLCFPWDSTSAKCQAIVYSERPQRVSIADSGFERIPNKNGRRFQWTLGPRKRALELNNSSISNAGSALDSSLAPGLDGR